MKTKLLTIGLFVTLVSCGEAKEETSNTDSKEQTENLDHEGAEAAAEGSSMDLVASIVNKGGAKAEDQVTIEAMMSSLEDAKAVEGWQSEVVGHWVGNFGKNKINISITKIDGENVEGFSVCAGNFRKIEGTVTAEEVGYRFVMEEPGTDKYDGTFDFMIDKDFAGLTGMWTPFKKEGNTEKNYSLSPKEFVYNAKVGEHPESSTKLMDYTDVENWDIYDLGYMRNEIYARHGYSFKNKEWRYVFEEKDWYVPMGVDIRHQLSDTEIQNIGLIYEYEAYYESYYDDYGR